MSSEAVEDGEKVIAASKRPDGTYRKERRVRAGYIPQDEQPVYQSKGTLFKQNVPKCPGLDEAEAAKKTMTKSAKKNAKRKEKKDSEASADDVAQSVTKLSVSGSADTHNRPPGLGGNKSHTSGAASPSSMDLAKTDEPPHAKSSSAATSNAATSASDALQNSGASAPPDAASQDVEKQLRNLRKKIRQAEATSQKAAEGKQLTPEEEEKLQKLKLWQAEEAKLAT